MASDSSPANNTPGGRKRPAELRADIESKLRQRKAEFDEANEKVTQRSGRNLVSAIAIGLGLGLPTLLSLIFIKEIFVVLAAILVALTAYEFASALRVAGWKVPRVPTVAATLVVGPAAYYWGREGQWLALIGAVLFVLLWRVAEQLFTSAKVPAKQLVRDLAAAVFVQVYVTFFGSIAILLLAQEHGQWWVLAFLITIISIDTGAYVFGLNFGKHKLAPTISPKKTWEGFLGAWLTGVVFATLLALFMLGMPWWFGLVLGTLMVITATVGDLAESLIKRDLGIKDMSSWLPGHGGFLDRLDSILPSAAGAYFLYLMFSSLSSL